VLMSAAVRRFGFGVSTLERLAAATPNPEAAIANPALPAPAVMMLLETYRAHPDIVALYQPTYGNRLVVRTDQGTFLGVAPRVFPTQKHAVFVHTEGVEQRENDSPSWMNLAEVTVVVNYVAGLLRARVPCVDIAVISPYQKQCSKIHGVFHYKFTRHESPFLPPAGWDGKAPLIQVKTTELYQGREAGFVVMSCVRSKKLEELASDKRFHIGFTSSPQRLNVAISRAREGLVVVGNMKTLSVASRAWYDLIQLACAAQLVVDGTKSTTAFMCSSEFCAPRQFSVVEVLDGDQGLDEPGTTTQQE